MKPCVYIVCACSLEFYKHVIIVIFKSINTKKRKLMQPVQLFAFTSLLTAEDVWFFGDLSLKFIPPINIWKIKNDLRLF